jgi:hypothetical protein
MEVELERACKYLGTGRETHEVRRYIAKNFWNVRRLATKADHAERGRTCDGNPTVQNVWCVIDFDLTRRNIQGADFRGKK